MTKWQFGTRPISFLFSHFPKWVRRAFCACAASLLEQNWVAAATSGQNQQTFKAQIITPLDLLHCIACLDQWIGLTDVNCSARVLCSFCEEQIVCRPLLKMCNADNRNVWAIRVPLLHVVSKAGLIITSNQIVTIDKNPPVINQWTHENLHAIDQWKYENASLVNCEGK